MAKKITKAGVRTESGHLTCPNCSGDDWETRRSWLKWVIGPLARETRIKCVTCGQKFKRG